MVDSRMINRQDLLKLICISLICILCRCFIISPVYAVENEMIRAPEDCRDMDEVRKEIDRIDKRLVKSLGERVLYIKRAAEIKRAQKIPALVPSRVEAVITHVKEQAAKEGVDPALAEKVWRDIVDWSVNYESDKLKK
jgi:isochorismate pyruvate lyase